MKFVRIQCNGTMDECNETINLRNIRKILENNSLQKGSKRIQHIYTWPHEDTSIICYGYMDGSPGTENKHDLPPSGEKMMSNLDTSDTQLLFGDIFMIKKSLKLCDLDVSGYGLFYSLCFEGFDDCNDDSYDSDDSDDSDDSNNSLNDFIVNDDPDNDDSESAYYVSDEELDEDTNEYQ